MKLKNIFLNIFNYLPAASVFLAWEVFDSLMGVHDIILFGRITINTEMLMIFSVLFIPVLAGAVTVYINSKKCSGKFEEFFSDLIAIGVQTVLILSFTLNTDSEGEAVMHGYTLYLVIADTILMLINALAKKTVTAQNRILFRCVGSLFCCVFNDFATVVLYILIKIKCGEMPKTAEIPALNFLS